MNYSPILVPVVALVAWTLVMLVWMAIARRTAFAKLGISWGTIPRGSRGVNLDGRAPDERSFVEGFGGELSLEYDLGAGLVAETAWRRVAQVNLVGNEAIDLSRNIFAVGLTWSFQDGRLRAGGDAGCGRHPDAPPRSGRLRPPDCRCRACLIAVRLPECLSDCPTCCFATAARTAHASRRLFVCGRQ